MSSPNTSIEEPTPEDTFKILVATDTHLGFAEKDPIRGQDSFTAFEEVLQLAVKREVDFVLLGGDLFHESKPSPYCIHRCLDLLRKYSLSDKAVCIEFLSDQSYHFQNQRHPIVNYEDPNLNVGIPVFSIHGNHDDPTGHKQVSALDMLASTGLINYFGRWNDLSKVEIRPILLKKGETKLALYGLSHIRDERLGRLFREKKVHMKKPSGDDWFNMLVLHQNRAARGVKNFIPDSALPDFMNLVIWGHEHDCRIEPEETASGVFISQPGSSVATSLAIGESFPKKVGLLQVYKQQFKIIPLPLTTVRPLLIDELVLENPTSSNYCLEKPGEQAIAHVKQKINDMIAMANSKHKNESKPPPLPLIRLKVFYHDERQQFNAVRIGMQFTNQVANPDDIIKLNSLISKERKKNSKLHLDEDDYEQFVNMKEWATCVEDVILKHFEKEELRDALQVHSAKGLTEAVSRVIRGDEDAFSVIIKKQSEKTQKQLLQLELDSAEKINEALCALAKQRLEDNPRDSEKVEQGQVISISDDDSDTNGCVIPTVKRENLQQYLESDDEFPITSTSNKPKKSKSETSRGGRGSRSRGSRGRGINSSYGTLDSFYK